MFEQLYESAPAIMEKVSGSKKILINIHVGADYDSICSALAMKNILETLGKSVTVFSPEPFDSEIMANRDLFANFSEITFKKFTDLDLKSYDLFFALDSDDQSRIGRFEKKIIPESLFTINIDHHAFNKRYGNINLVQNHTCTSELIFQLAIINHWTVSTETAKLLMIGLQSDTLFMYPDLISEETFRTYADLAKISGVDIPSLIWRFRTIDDKILMAAGQIISRCEKLFSGNVVMAVVTKPDLDKYGLKMDSIGPVKEFIAHNLSYTRNPAIVVVMVERDGWTKFSLRSNNINKFHDVSLICRKIPGGGGHPHGSGAEVQTPLTEARNLIIQLVHETYPDLGDP